MDPIQLNLVASYFGPLRPNSGSMEKTTADDATIAVPSFGSVL